jgi:copper transport protein
MRVEIGGSLDDGTYVVAWQALSADSHKVRGAYTFAVGQVSATAPGLVEELFDEAATGQSDSLLLGAGRFLSFAGIATLLGVLVVAAAVAPGSLGSPRMGALLGVAGAAGVIGTAWMIAGQAHLISGSYWSWGAVVDTRSGQWWVVRLVAALGLCVLVPFRGRLTGAVARVLVGVAGLGVLAVVAAGGHAVTGERVGSGVVATMVHLSAMTIWAGGLVLLVAGVSRSDLWPTAARFSPWALGSVALLAVSGTSNAWRQLGSFSGLTDSSYGRWLIIKLALVAIVLGGAAVSRRTLRSRSVDDPTALPTLRRSVTFEVAGLVLVLMATAGLVSSPPPPSSPENASGTAVVGERIVQVELEPAVTGGTEMHVYLTSPGGGLDRADEFTVEAELAADGIGPIEVDLVPAGPNHVIGPSVDLPVPGLWTFEVTARFGEFDQIVFPVQVPVASP